MYTRWRRSQLPNHGVSNRTKTKIFVIFKGTRISFFGSSLSFIGRLVEIWMFHQNQSLNRNQDLIQRRSAWIPLCGWASITVPSAELSLSIKQEIIPKKGKLCRNCKDLDWNEQFRFQLEIELLGTVSEFTCFQIDERGIERIRIGEVNIKLEASQRVGSILWPGNNGSHHVHSFIVHSQKDRGRRR